MRRFLTLLLALILASSAWATTNTYQSGASSCGNTNCGSATPDNALDQQNTTTNDGTGACLAIEALNGFKFHTALTFDISDISSVATVTTATLTLTWTGGATAGVGVCTGTGLAGSGSAYRIRHNDWSESQSTWTVYKTSNNWTTAGGTDSTNDIDTANPGTFTSTTSGTFDVTGLATLAQDAINNRSGKLYLLLKYDTEGGGAFANVGVASQDASTVSTRPKLSVTFTLPAHNLPLLGVGKLFIFPKDVYADLGRGEE